MENKKIISVEIPNTLREALRVEAFNKEVTVSALIRQILEEQLKTTIEECKIKNVRKG
jgi:plasmid stability protein